MQPLYCLRSPDGSYEYRSFAEAPAVGASVGADGGFATVTSVDAERRFCDVTAFAHHPGEHAAGPLHPEQEIRST